VTPDLSGVPPFALAAVEPEHARPRREDAPAGGPAEPSPAGEPHHRKLASSLRGVPAFAVVLLLGCSAPARPRPVPEVAAELAALEGRVEQLGLVRRAAERLNVAELELALASTPRERRAARAAWLDARHELRALAREPDQPERYTALRDQAHQLALSVVNMTPPGREQALALTKLEEAVFFANAAIARGE
jgi:hypothetical protein